MGRVLGHVGGSTTVLTTQCQALQQAQGDQDHRSRHTNAGIARKNTHDESGNTHDQNGDQEGVLAANHVAQAAKDDGTERTHDETGSKRQQCKDEGGALIQTAEELLGDDSCQ